ncbi:MAG: hypothetical protein M3N53_08710 [Actinomycetota bacterium]|nr:hypothetical protein [Actinomycetota bacterium]
MAARSVFEVIAFVVGLILVVGTAGSLFRTLVLPRAVSSRLSVFVGRRIVLTNVIRISRLVESYEVKDKILAFAAPMALLALLVTWLTLFFLGFALILWPLTGGTIGQALRESGSSMLTLGFAGQDRAGPTVVYFVAAATGLIVVALQIAYLPTLYQAFNKRETLVTMLQSRAGAPAWGPEILGRAHMVGIIEELRHLYAEWERWTAEVMESHTTYTVLIWFRSPHPLRSWVLALLAVLDSAALYLAFAPTSAPGEARLCLRMGFTCLRNIADVLRIPYDPDPFPDDPTELTYEQFVGGVNRLREIGFPMERTPEEAWPHFQGWRINYEHIAYTLADAVVAPPGPWSGPRSHLPGLTIVPQRPPNRSPDDRQEERPKAARFGWHA